MKKIGILFGQEDTFPWAVIEKINEIAPEDIMAEAVIVQEVNNTKPLEYDVVLDRISQDVPFYRSMLKNAALSGTCVVNNPFWWSADDKFFNYCLSKKIGVPTPKTALLPSHERPDDTSEKSFRNLSMMDWDKLFDYIGFPAFLKPYAGGGWKNVYHVHSKEDFFEAYHQTGQLVMTLQEAIDFQSYYRCYGLGKNKVHIMPYEPRNPHHERYIDRAVDKEPELFELMTKYVLDINHALGYEFNTVEFAVKDGVPYAIDFGNPAPDADYNSVGDENFRWVVQAAAEMLILKAQEHQADKYNLHWGTFASDTIK